MEAMALERSVDQLSAIASQSKGWLKFLGVLSIIGGVLTALSIIGILVAWLPILMGILLFQAGSQADDLTLTKDPNKLVAMMNKLRLYFMINGVVALIVIAGIGLSLLLAGGTIFSLLQSLQSLSR